MSKNLSQNREKAFQRCFYRSTGIAKEELEKPLVAVLSAEGKYAPETDHISLVSKNVAIGITAAGGNPVVIPVSALSNSLSAGQYGGKYILPSRDLISDTVESILGSSAYDGVVLVSNSAECLSGMLIGAIRVNIPTIVISGSPGEYRTNPDKTVSSAYSIFEDMGKLMANKQSLADMQKVEDNCDFSLGTGTGMHNTASISCIMEGMGIALPKTGSAGTTERVSLAKKTGEAIIKLINESITPKMILNKEAFLNGFSVATSVGASTSSVLDLIAIASECDIELNYDNLQTINNKTPTLCKLYPYSAYTVKDFHKAGGVMTVLKELGTNGLLKEKAKTCLCKSITETYADAEAPDGEIVSTVADPITAKGDILFFKGNIAEEGGIGKRMAFARDLKSFKGKAVCFNSEEDAAFAMGRGEIPEGSAIVIRFEGPKGGPGMRELVFATNILAGTDLLKSCILITDGRLSSYTKGTCIGHLCPEAFDNGKLAIVQNGDTIKLDMSAGKIDVDLNAKELQNRLKKLRPFDYHPTKYLLKYSKLVTSAPKGCVFKKKY